MRVKPQLADALRRTRQAMEDAVPDAKVTGFEGVTAGLALPDPDDRHVLAAAIVGRADVIVTVNLKDFPPAALAPFRIEAQHPDDFITHFLTLAPPVALAAIREMRARLKHPPYRPDDFVELLARQGLSRTVAFLQEHVALI